MYVKFTFEIVNVKKSLQKGRMYTIVCSKIALELVLSKTNANLIDIGRSLIRLVEVSDSWLNFQFPFIEKNFTV